MNDKINYTDEEERKMIESFENDDSPIIRNEKVYNDIILGKAFESLSPEDEKILKAEAEEEGIPYTSLLMKIIHQYAKKSKNKILN